MVLNKKFKFSFVESKYKKIKENTKTFNVRNYEETIFVYKKVSETLMSSVEIVDFPYQSSSLSQSLNKAFMSCWNMHFALTRKRKKVQLYIYITARILSKNVSKNIRTINKKNSNFKQKYNVEMFLHKKELPYCSLYG